MSLIKWINIVHNLLFSQAIYGGGAMWHGILVLPLIIHRLTKNMCKFWNILPSIKLINCISHFQSQKLLYLFFFFWHILHLLLLILTLIKTIYLNNNHTYFLLVILGLMNPKLNFSSEHHHMPLFTKKIHTCGSLSHLNNTHLNIS